MALTRSPYEPNTPQSYNAHNEIVNQVIDGVNNHSHDPNQGGATNSAGSYIPQFGAADVRYSSIGPDSASWATLDSQPTKAAIPADPSETAIDPVTGAVMTGGISSIYSGITYGHGIGVEIARIRGQLSKITGNKWYTPVGAMVSYAPGGSGQDLSAGAISSTTVHINPESTSTPPLNITYTGVDAPPMVSNLNTQYFGGYTASSAPGTPATILATNTEGMYDQESVAADPSETAFYTGSLAPTHTIQDNMANIRYVLQQWAQAAYGESGAWNTPATTIPPFVTGISASGTTLTGQLSLTSGIGVSVVQDGPSSFRFDSTGVAPFTDAPTLTYPDMFSDTVLYGSLAVSNTDLTVIVNSGMTGYVNGQRVQAGSGGYTFGPYTVVAGVKNYIWWNGGNQNDSYTVTQSSGAPAPGWVLAATGTLVSGATNATQTTATGGWQVITKTPDLNMQPSVAGVADAATVSDVDDKVNNLIDALSSMGLITDLRA